MNKNNTLKTVITVVIVALTTFFVGKASVYAKQNAPTLPPSSALFLNPINNNGADPWVCFYDGYYYMTDTTGGNVTITQSTNLEDISLGTQNIVWTPPKGSDYSDIWAPELHEINGYWYIYFAADHAGDNSTHRMYVLKSQNSNPLSKYTFVGELTTPDNNWAIDGTILSLNKQLYFIWSGWVDSSNTVTQNLYIAPMSSPTTISGNRTLLSSPTNIWENSVAPINEGPEILQHNGKTFLIYSANASWTNSYSLGMLTLNGSDPLQASNWVKSPQPVFASTNNVFGPGHASFTTSPDGTQNWIVYHAARVSGAGWDRNIRAQQFSWNSDGTPDFGLPLSLDTAQTIPSGEQPITNIINPINTTTTGKTYAITVAKAGYYGFDIRYANSSTGLITSDVDVNGTTVATYAYPTTGSFESNQLEFVSLQKGLNTIVLHSAEKLTTLSLNFLPTPFPAPAASPKGVYEAENALYNDDNIVYESNASNGAVIGMINNADSYVKFNAVTVNQSGTYTVTVRYDNGMSDCTDLISINGFTPFNLILPSTGAWNTFGTVTFNVSLNKGANTIQINHNIMYSQIDNITVSKYNPNSNKP